MLISHKHKFIFIHIYKTAGTSITHALIPFCSSKLKFNLHRVLRKVRIDTFNPFPFPKHISAESLSQNIGIEIYSNYFTFSFVRNPWDWQVSLYNFMLSHPEHPQHQLMKNLGSFDSYIQWRKKKGMQSQKRHLSDASGKIMVDFIGRYESLNDDFNTICKKIGASTSLPHIHNGMGMPYQYYYSKETKEIVSELCREDIEFFDYSFDD